MRPHPGPWARIENHFHPRRKGTTLIEWKKPALVLSAALLALGSLAGCGGSDDAKSSDSSSAGSSSSASAGSSDAAGPSASTGSSESSLGTEAQTPAGTKLFPAPKNGIQFAAPKDFQDAGKQKVEQAEVQVRAASPDAHGMTSNILVYKEPQNTAQIPTEDQLKPAVTSQNGTPKKYSTVETPLGKAATLDYSVKVQGVTAYGQLIAAPNGGGKVSILAVTAGNADEASKLGKDITASLQKA